MYNRFILLELGEAELLKKNVMACYNKGYYLLGCSGYAQSSNLVLEYALAVISPFFI